MTTTKSPELNFFFLVNLFALGYRGWGGKCPSGLCPSKETSRVSFLPTFPLSWSCCPCCQQPLEVRCSEARPRKGPPSAWGHSCFLPFRGPSLLPLWGEMSSTASSLVEITPTSFSLEKDFFSLGLEKGTDGFTHHPGLLRLLLSPPFRCPCGLLTLLQRAAAFF